MFTPPPFIESFRQNAQQAINSLPLKDFEKNAKSWFEGAIAHFNLVQKNELDNINLILEKTAEQVTKLEARISELEKGQVSTTEK